MSGYEKGQTIWIVVNGKKRPGQFWRYGSGARALVSHDDVGVAHANRLAWRQLTKLSPREPISAERQP